MIYLIRTKYEKISLLKIGYTEDSRKELRYTNYRLHNPLFELLYEILNGTEECEKLLQVYFSEFQYEGYGNEWFYECNEIIDYFETHRTLDSLSDLQDCGLVIDRAKFYQFRDFVEKIINLIVNKKVDLGDISLENGTSQVSNLVNNILVIKHIKSYARFWKYIEDVFGYKENDLLNQIYSNSIQEFLIQFDSYTQFTDKMKFLCDSVGNFSEEEFSSILGSINLIYKNYYITLGRDRIRALQYRKYALDYEISRISCNQDKRYDLNIKIQSNFIVSNRYTKVFVKEKLGEIYNNLGIQSSPKATDIENYFEVKKVQITNKETGKKDHGYLILKIKE